MQCATIGGVARRSIRGDALMASVKHGGGAYHGPEYSVYQLAAGAVVTESLLRGVVSIHQGRVQPGAVPGEGALEELARRVSEEPKALKLGEWLRRTGPWAREAIERELEEAGLARGWTRRILFVYREPCLEILDQGAQDEVFHAVRETFLRAGMIDREEALLILLLREVAVLQHLFRTTRGRGHRRRFGELWASLPEDVQVALKEYERWQPRGCRRRLTPERTVPWGSGPEDNVSPLEADIASRSVVDA